MESYYISGVITFMLAQASEYTLMARTILKGLIF